MKQFIEKIKAKKPLDFFMLIFPISVFYYETVFCFATAGQYFKMGLLYTLLFSISAGFIGYLISTIFKKKIVNTWVTCVTLALTAVFFLVEYFTYRYFNIFYDINTIVGGAKDAASGFGDIIFQLIFSLEGLFVIFLFFLPTILYAIFGRKYVPALCAGMAKRITAAIFVVLFYALSILTVSFNSVYNATYGDEYNFQSAVSYFGLVTGVRLDLQNYFFGDADSFENVETLAPMGNSTNTSSSLSSSEDETVKDYGYNMLNLDLSGGSSSSIKELNSYVGSLTPSKKNEYTGLFKGKNLIMITAEAFTAEAIDPVLTPTLYRLSTKGINFTDYYQPASSGTTGGEYQNIFGMMPTAGGMSFKNTADNLNYFTMGSQLDRLGYYGMAYHNNSYTYYSRHKTHVNLGYSGGFMGYGNGMEQYVKNSWPQSDLQMIEGTLPTYIDKQPFNIYYMSVSGHSGYNRLGNAMCSKNYKRVEHLNCSEDIKCYYAANLELEDAMAHLVSQLEAKGIADDTVICISSDHFPYGLDQKGSLGNMPNLSELYGYNVTNLFQRDHSRLIIWSGCLEDKEPIIVSEPTFSLDIVPTLSNLFGTEYDSRLFVGRDVFSDAPALVFNMNYDFKTELGTYYASKNEFVPKDDTVNIPDDYVKTTKSIIRNKIRFCSGVLNNDYFAAHFSNKD